MTVIKTVRRDHLGNNDNTQWLCLKNAKIPNQVALPRLTSAGRRRVERVKGIEPSYEAWEAAVLPLNYTRTNLF